MALPLFSGGGGYDLAAVPLVVINRNNTQMSSGLNLSWGLESTANITSGADTWQTVVDITGAGFLRGVAVFLSSPGAGTGGGLRITIDGTAYEKEAITIAANAPFLICTPSMYGLTSSSTDYTPMFVPHSLMLLRFASSLKIEARRKAGTPTMAAGYTYSLDRS